MSELLADRNSLSISTYSSFGPTNGLYLFPSIAAPGASIISTVPGGVGILRGTSMAAPLICTSFHLTLCPDRD